MEFSDLPWAFGPLDGIANCLILLAIVEHEVCRFKCRNQSEEEDVFLIFS